MVKSLRIDLDDSEYEQWIKIKNNSTLTWYDLLKKGIAQLQIELAYMESKPNG